MVEIKLEIAANNNSLGKNGQPKKFQNPFYSFGNGTHMLDIWRAFIQQICVHFIPTLVTTDFGN